VPAGALKAAGAKAREDNISRAAVFFIIIFLCIDKSQENVSTLAAGKNSTFRDNWR
jgi:hypothetical protein